MTRPADFVDDAWAWVAGGDVGTNEERGGGGDEKSGRWESCEHVFLSVKEWTCLLRRVSGKTFGEEESENRTYNGQVLNEWDGYKECGERTRWGRELAGGNG